MAKQAQPPNVGVATPVSGPKDMRWENRHETQLHEGTCGDDEWGEEKQRTVRKDGRKEKVEL